MTPAQRLAALEAAYLKAEAYCPQSVLLALEQVLASLRADVEAPAHAPVMHDCEQWAQEGMGCAHCNSSAVALREVWADDPVRAERDALRLQVAALSAAPPADGAPCGLLKPGSSFSRCVRWPDHEGPCVYAIEAAPPAPTPRRHCLGDVCDLAKSTGVFCAHDECDIDLGVRTVAAPAPTPPTLPTRAQLEYLVEKCTTGTDYGTKYSLLCGGLGDRLAHACGSGFARIETVCAICGGGADRPCKCRMVKDSRWV